METKTIENTPIAMLTAKQLKDYLFGEETDKKPTSKTDTKEDKRYLYSVKQLATFLKVSYPTAHKLKETVLKPAVYQQGRTILIDADKVLTLMGGANNG